MRKSDFHFDLPPRLIAQHPAKQRSASRLLALEGGTGTCTDLKFTDVVELIHPGDLLVLNDTRVVPARVYGAKPSGGRVEVLLERILSPTTALTHVRASKGLKPGASIILPGGQTARMLAREGEFFCLEFASDVAAFFEAHGEMPLPPYIARTAEPEDRERYQTVFARTPGAVAAPTAGLHFDRETLAAVTERGALMATVTLHVGSGTFAPMRVDEIDQHHMHSEFLEVPQRTVEAVRETHAAGRRVIAVGTTVVRALESAAAGKELEPYRGMTDIFIRPGYRFRVVDAMLTNFHLPESTLVMLCAAFVGRESLLAAYAHAVQQGYRFFSYGDAMFLTPGARAAPRA